jgi:hypothetical protein
MAPISDVSKSAIKNAGHLSTVYSFKYCRPFKIAVFVSSAVIKHSTVV